MKVQGEATVAQLRGYINSTAGFAAAGPSKRLLYRQEPRMPNICFFVFFAPRDLQRHLYGVLLYHLCELSRCIRWTTLAKYILRTSLFQNPTPRFDTGRGVHLHDDQTLRECDISTGSQLVLIHTEVTTCAGLFLCAGLR